HYISDDHNSNDNNNNKSIESICDKSVADLVKASDSECERRKRFIPKWAILISMTVVLTCALCTEYLFGGFAASFFQYQPVLRLSASQASHIVATMNGAFAVGRFLSIFAVLYMSPQKMAVYQLSLSIFGYIFFIFGQNYLYTL